MGKSSETFKDKRFKLPRLTSALKLAISRAGVLKNQRQSRSNHARTDVVHLLQQDLFERAVVRAEQVIKEQNMADVYMMIDNYCNLLLERAYLVEQERECPEELREAAASLIHASTRCGEFPELQEIRAIFTLKYGKDFTARAVELRNSCGVNPTMIQKLSTRLIEYDKRAATVNEIAANINVKKANFDSGDQAREHKSTDGEYENVADAAQAAFESAARAAAAAKAVVELSRLNDTKSLGKEHAKKTSDDEKSGDMARVCVGDGGVQSLDDGGVVVDWQKGEIEISSETDEVDDGAAKGRSSDRVAFEEDDGMDLNRNKTERQRNVFSRLFGRNKGLPSKPSHFRDF